MIFSLGCLNFSAIAPFKVVNEKKFGQQNIQYGQTGLLDEVFFSKEEEKK